MGKKRPASPCGEAGENDVFLEILRLAADRQLTALTLERGSSPTSQGHYMHNGVGCHALLHEVLQGYGNTRRTTGRGQCQGRIASKTMFCCLFRTLATTSPPAVRTGLLPADGETSHPPCGMSAEKRANSITRPCPIQALSQSFLTRTALVDAHYAAQIGNAPATGEAAPDSLNHLTISHMPQRQACSMVQRRIDKRRTK